MTGTVMIRGRLTVVSAVLLTVLLVPNVSADEYTLVDIFDLRSNERKVVAVRVTSPLQVHIEAVGGRFRNSDRMFAFPWIIDAETRELVWSMDEEFTRRVRDREYLRLIEDDIRLKPGTYEVSYYAGKSGHYHYRRDIDVDDLKELKEELRDLIDEIFGSGKKSDDRVVVSDFYAIMTSNADDFVILNDIPGPPSAPITLNHPRNDDYLTAGFELASEADLEVYGIGEYSEWTDVAVDWGWIIDARTRKRVWEMDRWNTDWAGGAEKNRYARETITLPAGTYMACYATDDSHTYDDWNDNPPYDPEAWGLRVWPSTPEDAAVFGLADLTDGQPVVVELTQVCDNEFLSGGFRLNQDSEIRVYAIGEDDRYSDGLADYAMIKKAATGERVWMMHDDNTQYAGGAAKNQLFDNIITLPADEYIVHYVTDGSHSYCDWNASPPYDQRAYGVTLYYQGKGSEAGAFETFEPSRSPTGALAAITCVGGGERRRERFTLEKVTRINIHAVGEGDRDEMYDYGWIERFDDGEVVWEMTYRKTRHAGGADKNRLVDQAIILDKGSYVVYYVTDNSHSCNDYNAAQPDDPLDWGIVITESK